MQGFGRYTSYVALVVKKIKIKKIPPANAGDARDSGWIPGPGRSPGEGSGCPLQYSCLGNPVDRGAWCATVHGVAKSRMQLSTHIHTHVYLNILSNMHSNI